MKRFGLAVGLRPIGPSAQVPDLVSLERLTEAAGDGSRNRCR